jgi:hypothetical protein
MTDRELMQQALDALEKMKAHSYLRLDYAEEAISALRDRLEQTELVQVSPLEFVTAVLEKEHLVGKPLMWAQWPNEEKK